MMSRRTARLFSSLLWAVWCLGEGYGGVESEGTYQLTINMPEAGVQTLKHNDYKCTTIELATEDSYIVQFEPRANPKVAHHMLLFGCELPGHLDSSWTCSGMGDLCSSGRPKVLFGWALGAQGIHLPEGVGLMVGPSQNSKFAVLQIHYGNPQAMVETEGFDNAALTLHMTKKWQPNIAGIYLLGSVSKIRAGQKDAHVETACRFNSPKTIHPFAFRTHAHSMGKVIAGYVVKAEEGGRLTWELIGHRSPQEAQAFYPVENDVEVKPGDLLAAQCVFNTENMESNVHMGLTSEDEMCNYYIMYYTANDGKSLKNTECWYAPPNLRFPEIPPLPLATINHSMVEEHEHQHTHTEGEEEGEEEEEEDQAKTIFEELETMLSALSSKQPASEGEDGKELEGEEKNAEKNSEEGKVVEEEEDYICPNPIPPGPPSLCTPQVSPTPTPADGEEAGGKEGDGPKTPFFEAEDNITSNSDRNLVLSEDWILNGVSNPIFNPKTWPVALGQASAVAVDKEGYIHVLHRGARVWDYDSFNRDNLYLHTSDGPIHTPTLLKFSVKGELVAAWGGDVFYLPHGLTIDSTGSFWVTDVAMHQVYKFAYEAAPEPAMVLGTEFEPGNKFGFFCKPSSVAVEDSGVFYVADGYCNHRILQFSALGDLTGEWAEPVGGVFLSVPHSLALSTSQDELYVADRENKRIVSYKTATGEGSVFSNHGLGRIFAISFSRGGTWPLYTISVSRDNALGLSLDDDGNVINTWGVDGGFTSPHDLTSNAASGAAYVVEIGPNRIWEFVPVGSDHNTDVPADLLTEETATSEAPPTTEQETTEQTSATSVTTESTPSVISTTADSTTDPASQTSMTTSTTESTTEPASQTSMTPSTTGITSQTDTTPITTESTTDPTSFTGSQSTTVSVASTTGSETTSPPTSTTPKGDSETGQTSSEITSPTSEVDVPGTNATEVYINGTSGDNQTGMIESVKVTGSRDSKHKRATEYGLLASLSFMAILVVLVVGGIMSKQGVFRNSWARVAGITKGTTGKCSKGGGTHGNKEKKKSTARDTLHSLLGPGKFGFSRLRTYDSDSEREEFPVFNRV